MPTILVADDSLSVRKVAERMLVEAGLEVALAANGEEAMSLASSRKPDLIIADVIMPDKSGFEVCAYIRAQASLTNTPVLLVSGFVDDEVTRQAEACRADGVIKKPFQGAMLRERVMELLSSRKAPEAPAAAPAPELVLEMPAIAPAPELVLEMPAIAPAPEITIPAAPPIPPPAPTVTAAPAAAGAPAVQLAGEMRTLRETIQRLEGRLAEQGKDLVRLEQQLQASREGAAGAVTKAQSLEARLAEAEKQSAELRQRLADLEPAAASAKQLLQMLVEFARQTIKP